MPSSKPEAWQWEAARRHTAHASSFDGRNVAPQTFEAPEVPTDKGDCMTLVRLQAETRGLSIRRSRTAWALLALSSSSNIRHSACPGFRAMTNPGFRVMTGALPGPHRRSTFEAGHRCRLNLGPFGLREPALLQVPPLLGSTCHGQRVGPVCCDAVATAHISAARDGALH